MCSKKSLKSWASIWRVKTKRQDWSSVHGVSKTMAQRAMLCCATMMSMVAAMSVAVKGPGTKALEPYMNFPADDRNPL